MNQQLVDKLKELLKDPTIALEIYEQLFNADLIALVFDPKATHDRLSFLTYETTDGLCGLPVFTSNQTVLLSSLEAESTAKRLTLNGHQLWPILLKQAEDINCQIEIDAGEDYGIRLSKEMLLGMIAMYAKRN